MAKTVARKKSAARHGYHHKIVGASFEEAEFQGPRTWFIASALLALIGIWGLLAWLLGLPLGGEIRSDPFGLDAKASMPSRLVDGFLSTIPHPALGRMEVVPSGLSGVLTPRDFEPVATEGAAAPSPSLSDFVNSPQTAMEKILANRNTGPAAASRDGSPPRHFVFAGEAPSSKQSGPSSKSPPSQKGGPSPDQSTVSGKTDGEPSPVESSEPQPAIEQKTIEPSQPNPVEQNTVKPNPAGEPKPTEPSPPTREEPVLLAGLVLIGKDGKDHLVAIDTAQHLLGFDETKGSWRPISRNSDFLGIDNSLVVSPIREAGFGVGYYLSDSWIVFRSGEEPNVFPFMNLSEHAQIHYPVWTGDGFLANQTGAQGFDGIEIIQQDKPNFGLTQIFVPPSKAQPSFYSVTLAPQEAGHWAIWSGGDKGLLKMRDDGEIVLREVQISAPIRSIFFETPTQGWASSGWEGADRPVVLETSDGGQTWQVIPYRWLPAPWVFLSFVVAVGAFWRGTDDYVARSQVTTKPSIAEHGVSDNPIGLNDPDALGLVPIAKAMSRFLRNVQTTPSLAIGISGPWGSGKSSLMRLVREDLEDRGIRSVEFNAWHHQHEESLLAALLTVVRARAVPPIWTWSGLRVRLGGALQRIKANPFGVFGVLALAGFLGFGIWLLGPRLLAWMQGAGAQATEPSTFWAALGISASALAVIQGLWKVLQPLTAMPAKLLATVSSRSSRKDLEQQLAFRYCFAQEFCTFCSALRRPPHPGLVILVDDLDRCGPKQTVEILEALNFVSSAGNCFIILGFDEQKVKAAIADVYKDTVLELHDTDSGDLGELKKEDLLRFSTNYLEKLVHLVVPVPRTNDDAVEKLLGLTHVPPPSRAERTQRRMRHLAAEAAIPLLLLLGGAVTLAALAVPRLPSVATIDAWRHGPAATPTVQVEQSSVTSKGQPAGVTANGGTPSPQSGQAAQPRKLLTSAARSSLEAVPAPAYIALAFIILLLPVAWLTRHFSVEAIVDDSPSFREALRIWDDLIAIRRQTPRAIKRFMNRLRFLAMRVRDVANEEHARGNTAPLDEPLLVTYVAMEEFGETEPATARRATQRGNAEFKAQLDHGIEEFTIKFHRNPKDESHSREVYRRIAGIVEERVPSTHPQAEPTTRTHDRNRATKSRAEA